MSKEDRKQARSDWPGRKFNLADEPVLDPDVLAMTPSARVAMVWQVTRDAWAWAGRCIPTYERGSMPGRILRKRD